MIKREFLFRAFEGVRLKVPRGDLDCKRCCMHKAEMNWICQGHMWLYGVPLFLFGLKMILTCPLESKSNLMHTPRDSPLQRYHERGGILLFACCVHWYYKKMGPLCVEKTQQVLHWWQRWIQRSTTSIIKRGLLSRSGCCGLWRQRRRECAKNRGDHKSFNLLCARW